MLESWRLEVLEAANGLIGLALFYAYKPSLVITDILMPEMDGIEFLRELREIDPQAKVIAMSGTGGAKYTDPLALAKTIGVVAALEKPFRLQQLRTVVYQAFLGDIALWGRRHPLWRPEAPA